VIQWAAPFVLLDGRRAPYQLELWADGQMVR